MDRKTQYGVVCQQVITDGGKWEIVYNFDHRLFDTRRRAVLHGFKIRESDDFNIITVKNGALTGFWWMSEEMSEGHDLAGMAEEFGLTGADR